MHNLCHMWYVSKHSVKYSLYIQSNLPYPGSLALMCVSKREICVTWNVSYIICASTVVIIYSVDEFLAYRSEL